MDKWFQTSRACLRHKLNFSSLCTPWLSNGALAVSHVVAVAASYYNNNHISHAAQHPQAASPGADPGGQAQYDMSERPLGPGKDHSAMAMGALTGLAKKMMMGGGHGHHGGKHSSGSHALIAEGAKMLYGMYKDNSNKPHGQGQGQAGYGSSHGYQQRPQYVGHGSPSAQHGGGRHGSSEIFGKCCSI